MDDKEAMYVFNRGYVGYAKLVHVNYDTHVASYTIMKKKYLAEGELFLKERLFDTMDFNGQIVYALDKVNDNPPRYYVWENDSTVHWFGALDELLDNKPLLQEILQGLVK